MKKFYLTTPLYYVNDEPHIGHTYTTVVADAVARYKRMRGFNVHFLTGTDEHGQKIERAARSAGLAPKELADKIVDRYYSLWKTLRITYDDFIRTTEERHEKGVLKLFETLQKNGALYLGDYEGWYCTPCETFWLEAQVADGNCPDCKRAVEKIKEKTYFFRLSNYQDALLKLYEENPQFTEPPHRKNEVVSFVRSGLKDLSISRTTVKWGIPVPGSVGHTLYVWFDALVNYISAVGYGWDDEKFKKLWPADIHLVGKDILRFHAVYWPAFLIAGGITPPKIVYGHGWWLSAKDKMSKSKGNVIRPDYLIKEFGVDALRYFLLREMVFGEDASFSDSAITHRLNSDIANDLGNLLSRAVKLIEGLPDKALKNIPGDSELKSFAESAVKDFLEKFDAYDFCGALRSAWSFIGEVNKYIDRNEPWRLAKDSSKSEELEKILANSAESLRIVAVLISPVCPGYAEEILKQLGVPQDAETLKESDLAWSARLAGAKVAKGKPLFMRKDLPASAGKPKEVNDMTLNETIDITDFAKVKIRVAQILFAEQLPKSKKLIKLIISLGSEERQIVAGIAERYTAADLVGKKILVLTNLKPAKLMGVESNGMLLAAVGDRGEPYVIFAPDDAPAGSAVA